MVECREVPWAIFLPWEENFPYFWRMKFHQTLQTWSKKCLTPLSPWIGVSNGHHKTHERLKLETAREAAKCFKFIWTCEWIPQQTEVVQNCHWEERPTHFPCCKELAEELSNYEVSDFCTFISNIEGMMEEFQTRFTDFEITKNDIALFNNPFIVVLSCN
jgi:hypothetical protein